MAVDPITAKILTHLAAQAAIDEKTRKRIFMLILVPVLFLLVLIALIVYLLTSPLSLFIKWTLGREEVAAIEAFQKDYGYNQNIGIYDADYAESYGKSYEDVFLQTAAWR